MSTTMMQIKQLREATYASVLDCAKALDAHNGDFDKALEQLRSIGLNKAKQQMNRETREGLVIVKQSDNSVCAIEINCETDFVALTQEFKQLAHQIADLALSDPALTAIDRVLAADCIDRPGQTVSQAIKELAGKLGENITLSRVARFQRRETSVIEGYIHAGAIEGYGPMEGRLGVLVELETDGVASVGDISALQDLAHDLALQIASANPTYVSRGDIPAAELEEQRKTWLAQLEADHKPDEIKAKIIDGQLNKFYQEACLLSQVYIRDEHVNIGDLLQQASEQFGAPIQVVQFARFELRR